MRDIRFFSSILWQEEQDFWTSSLVMGIPSSSGFSSLAGVSAFFCSCPRTMRACRKRAIAAREMTNPALIVGPENRSQGLYHKDTKTQRCAKFAKVCKVFWVDLRVFVVKQNVDGLVSFCRETKDPEGVQQDSPGREPWVQSSDCGKP